jgi:hypothetical protein
MVDIIMKVVDIIEKMVDIFKNPLIKMKKWSIYSKIR